MSSLWGGRFGSGMDDAMTTLNRSLGTDLRLWSQDIRGSRAWVQALAGAKVISGEEESALLNGLGKVEERLASEDFSQAPDEDVHSLVERLLHEGIGEVAGKLHTGRSRNDQVATDFRLWGMEAADTVDEALQGILKSIVSLAENTLDVILPGHTHLQQAQPIRGAHWALSHFWPLLRDRRRVQQARDAASSLPLGSGALAGCPFPVDREKIRETLGFQRVSENSLDAVLDRDWVAELAFSGALIGIHLSRLAEDLVIFSSREFGYVEFPEGYCTGSSLMPQKRNPDAAELIRGKTGRLLGNLTGFLTLLKGLPSGYNRDLQEDKELLFDTVDTLLLVSPVMAQVIGGLRFKEENIQNHMDVGLLATDLADYLVRKGVPFRKSHHVVGELVRAGEARDLSLAELPLSVFQEAHPAFEDDVKAVFTFESSVESRRTRGGTARAAVQEQLAAAREALNP
jgi:argininosuccinate lyase